ncbi:MAG: glycosyltransferase [Myxococcales bacterium]|nr:glycosyltransferase [Myxococcales bacterium]
MTDALSQSSELCLEQFHKEYGRAPRVLHLGNIANNAYLNARILNDLGFESHVLVSNYYHAMGWPEWEECSFETPIGDHFAPRFRPDANESWRRPSWFVQGPRELCRRLLVAMQTGAASERFWRRLLDTVLRFPRLRAARRFRGCELIGQALRGDFRNWYRYLGRIVPFLGRTELEITSPTSRSIAESGLDIAECARREAELAGWMGVLRYYDVVVGYATEGWVPLFAGIPYIAYEHGTIRKLPFETSTEGKLCAITYRRADQVLITNCDNIDAAQRLGLTQYRFIPHPVNERRKPNPELRGELVDRCQAEFLVFHPARQHWEEARDPSMEKGNDIFLRGFSDFAKRARTRAGAILVNWGETVDASKALIDELGIRDQVIWIEPQPHLAMSEYVVASDVVADQFYLGAFGSITPKAMFLERPVLLNLDKERHRWAFPELPPVCHASTPGEVTAQLERLEADPEAAREIGIRGRRWYESWHSNRVVGNTLAETITDTLRRRL